MMNCKGNVILFSKEFPPNIVGGTALVARTAAYGLRDLKYHVTVVTTSSNGENYIETVNEITFIYIGNDATYHKSSGLDNTNIRYHKKVIDILKAANIPSPKCVLLPDLFSFPEAYLFSKYYKIPIINILLQDFRKIIPYDKGLTHKVMLGANGTVDDLLRIEEKVIAVSDANVFISNSLLDSIVSYYNPKLERCHMVYLGIDKDEIDKAYYSDTTELRESICPSNRKLIMSIGRHVPVKGFDKLIQAFSIIHRQSPETFLCILGKGPEDEYLNEMICELNLQNSVRLIYEPDRERVLNIMNSCDIAVVPSLWESFCYVAAEFMGLGKPLVVCGVDSLNELVVDNETGLICPITEIGDKRIVDEKMLAKCIKILCENSMLSDLLGDAARERALELFNQEKFAYGISRIIESL